MEGHKQKSPITIFSKGVTGVLRLFYDKDHKGAFICDRRSGTFCHGGYMKISQSLPNGQSDKSVYQG